MVHEKIPFSIPVLLRSIPYTTLVVKSAKKIPPEWEEFFGGGWAKILGGVGGIFLMIRHHLGVLDSDIIITLDTQNFIRR